MAQFSKFGHDFRKYSDLKVKARKKNVYNKKWSPKLIFFSERKELEGKQKGQILQEFLMEC
jgi:hypothetical protein